MTFSPKQPNTGVRRPTRRPSDGSERLFQSPAVPPTLFQLQNLDQQSAPESHNEPLAAEKDALIDESVDADDVGTEAPSRIESMAANVSARAESVISDASQSSPFRNVVTTLALLVLGGFAFSWVVSNVEYSPTVDPSSVADVADETPVTDFDDVTFDSQPMSMQAPAVPTPAYDTSDFETPDFEAPKFEINAAEITTPEITAPAFTAPEIDTATTNSPRFAQTNAPNAAMEFAPGSEAPNVIVDLTEPVSDVERMAVKTSLNPTADPMQTEIPTINPALTETLETQLPDAVVALDSASNKVASNLPTLESMDPAGSAATNRVVNDLDMLAAQVEQFDALNSAGPLNLTPATAQAPAVLRDPASTHTAMIPQTVFGQQTPAAPNQANAQLVSGQPSAASSQMASQVSNVTSRTPVAPNFNSPDYLPNQGNLADAFGANAQTAPLNSAAPMNHPVSEPGNVLSRTPQGIHDWARYLPPAR